VAPHKTVHVTLDVKFLEVPQKLTALGRIHEKVKAERTAREADEWHDVKRRRRV